MREPCKCISYYHSGNVLCRTLFPPSWVNNSLSVNSSETLTQCWFDVGPASKTVGVEDCGPALKQHWVYCASSQSKGRELRLAILNTEFVIHAAGRYRINKRSVLILLSYITEN